MNRPDPAQTDIVSGFSTSTSLLACGFGLVVLAGWAFHVTALRTIIPGQVAVKANTAACFVVIGLMLWRLQQKDLSRWEKGIALVSASVVGLIGLLSFLECCYGWDLRIDQILFLAGPDDLPGSIRPGLMSPITAASFFLLGPAVFLLVPRKPWSDVASQALTVVTGALSMFGILDFVLEASSSHTYISPITALILLLFSFGVVLSRRESGLSALIASPNAGGRLARRLFPAAIAIPIGIAWLRWHLQVAGFYSAWTGLALMTVASVVLLCLVTTWTAAATERAAVEELNARASALRLGSIVNSSIDAIIGKTLDGIVTDWNPAAEAIYGYKAEEIVGRPITVLIPAERDDEFQEIMKRIRGGEAVHPYETVRLHKDGHRIHVSLSIGPIKNEQGDVVGASAIFRDITERKLADEKLREASHYTRSLIEASLDPLVTISADGKITDVNRATETATGVSRDRLIGSDFCNYFTEPEKARQGYERVFADGFVRDYPLALRHVSGSVIDILYNATVFKNERGEIAGVFAAARDITQRKRAELALNRSERRYRSLVTATTQIVWATNPLGEVTDDMPMWRAFTGMGVEQIRGCGWIDSLHPDDRKRTAEIWNRSVRERSLYDTEYRIRRRDGEYRTVAVRGVPVFDPDGSIREWIGTCTDITERKRAEVALLVERQRFRDVLDKLPAYVVLLTPDYHVALDNTVFRERFGEHRGRPCYEFLFERNTPCEVCETYNVMKTGRPHRWNWTGPDGRNYEIFDFPFSDTDGSPLILEMGLDVTEQKKAEEEVRRLNNELEQRVIQRTGQLEAANKELEAFTYSVSHDLRAPLRHISGFSKILMEEFAASLPPDALHHVQRIQDGTRRMGQLVDDLLNLGRVGRREPTLQVAGLRSIVDEVIDNLKVDVGERSVEWKIGELPYVECDTALMHQVFQNLLSNALKFTRPRTQAVIEVGQEQRGGEAVVYVRDNGVGFSMKYADKLFGVFQRLHRSEDFEGTGVGLATVQRIIQKHGGRIWAEAELDKGACFYITLGSVESPGEKTRTMVAGEK